MIDRPKDGENAVLVHVNFPADTMQEDQLEFNDLAVSAGAKVKAFITGSRQKPEPKYFVGLGKAHEIADIVRAEKADIVLFNHTLSPSQERNLEKLFHCRVLDRTGLILDIFAQRARSFEGKLQVELALLKHTASRLVRGWTHLERQAGGIGLRGPGETQLETDRRLIKQRIKIISERLKKVKLQRDQGRRSRKKGGVPTIALVGYTNAGKSTLFNVLTGDDTYAADQLFATLDPTLRKITIPEVGNAVLADTVGFIRHLPHDLIQAFRATLQEVAEADLLLHVVDANDLRLDENIQEVTNVLETIKAQNVPQILVFNKIDLQNDDMPTVHYLVEEKINRVRMSALTHTGLTELLSAIREQLSQNYIETEVILSPKEGKMRAKLYELNVIVSEHIDDQGDAHITVKMPKAEFKKYFKDTSTDF